MKQFIRVVGLGLLIATKSLTAQAVMPTLPLQEASAPSGQFDQKARELEEKYNALTAEQKSQLAELTKEVRTKQLELLRKYVEFGLISQQDASTIEKSMEQGMGSLN